MYADYLLGWCWRWNCGSAPSLGREAVKENGWHMGFGTDKTHLKPYLCQSLVNYSTFSKPISLIYKMG